MYVIGITGPSGAGKTTALRVLEELGGLVYDCDAVYHQMLRTDPELLGQIEAAFPGSVVNGALDRKALGTRVFADPAGLQGLTDITQPLVAKRVLEEIAKASAPGGRPMAAPTNANLSACHSVDDETEPKNPSPPSPVPDSRFPVPFRFAVIDAIGLFESGLAEHCDLTVAVIADPEIRVRRLTARDGVTEEYARARITAQKPADWYASQADLVLENNGPEAEFEARCQRVFTLALRYRFLDLREQPELERQAAVWFQSKWGVPVQAYLDCMDVYLAGETALGWYLCMHEDQIVGGLGVIENDFHNRKDLTPNICAVYVEEAHRGRGIAGRLLNMAVEDLRAKGISPVYLVTDHTGFYERYGWEFFCHAQGDGEDDLTRLYIHR